MWETLSFSHREEKSFEDIYSMTDIHTSLLRYANEIANKSRKYQTPIKKNSQVMEKYVTCG